MPTSGYFGFRLLPKEGQTCSTHAPSSSSLCTACGTPMAGATLTCMRQQGIQEEAER